MGGKNLCVTSQHNASSVSVLPHHISLNGDQTTTTLPIANPPNAESVKTNVKVMIYHASLFFLIISLSRSFNSLHFTCLL